MDNHLKDRLASIAKQIEVLAKVENDYLVLEAHSDVLYAEMFRKSSKSSVADREAEVYDSPTWINFSRGLAEAHARFNKERRNYELKMKAYDAEHLTYKVENQAIKRGVE